MVKIKHLECLQVKRQYKTFYGFDQAWYRKIWRRTAGCGPTVATMSLVYLNHRDDLGLSYRNQGYNSIVDSVNQMWDYVTPGFKGLNTLELYEKGLHKLAEEHKLKLSFQKLKIDGDHKPKVEDLSQFVTKGLQGDNPVAFLNWHNGHVKNLDNWHWVLIIAIEGNKVYCYDQGKKMTCDLKEWLSHTKKGGGLIYFTT